MIIKQPMAFSLLTAIVISYVPLALAKNKTSELTIPSDIVWLNGVEVVALFEGGYWCAEPVGNTCGFVSTSLGAGPGEISYEVRGHWTDNEIYSLVVHATVAADGILCEPTELNIEGLSATNVAGIPVNKSRMAQIRQQFIQIYNNKDEDFVCFGYAIHSPEQPHRVTQYEIDIEYNVASIVEFDVLFAANADREYILRMN